MPSGIYKRTPEQIEQIKKIGFKKGHPYRFKKGHKPVCPFKKGHKPWNTGKRVFVGKKNPNWKNGKFIDTDGYILIYKPEHPFARNKKYILEHRLVIEKFIGRYLLPTEDVHHLGIKYPLGSKENKSDNRPQNLMAFINRSTHRKFEFGKQVKLSEIIFDGRQV